MHLPNNHHITHKSTAGSIPLSLFSVFYASENFIKVDQMWCTFKNYKLWSGKKVGKKTYPSPWYNYVRNETALNVWFMTNLYFWKHKSHSAEMALFKVQGLFSFISRPSFPTWREIQWRKLLNWHLPTTESDWNSIHNKVHIAPGIT